MLADDIIYTSRPTCTRELLGSISQQGSCIKEGFSSSFFNLITQPTFWNIVMQNEQFHSITAKKLLTLNTKTRLGAQLVS